MEFKLPEIGEGVHEGELVRWLVKDGDSVSQDQALIEVMTDKATVEVPAPSSGVIKGITAKEGDMIKVGATLATIEEGAGATKAPEAPAGESKAAEAAAPAAEAKPTAQGASGEPTAPAQNSPAQNGSAQNGASQNGSAQNQNGAGGQVGIVTSQPSKQEAPKGVVLPPQSASSAAYVGAQDSLSASSVPAAPIVRSMARDAGVDLAQVPATGPNVGDRPRVLEDDLMKFLATRDLAPSRAVSSSHASSNGKTAAAPQAPAPQAGSAQALPVRSFGMNEEVERKPVRGLRRVIAQAMVKSKYTAPHYSYVDEFECSQLVEMREQAKKAAEKYGIKFTYLPFIIKALVGALKEFPIANSSLEETDHGMELVYKKYYHIGFAVATNDGLIVPVIKHADKKTLLEIAQELTDLSNKVRAGKAGPDELRGSTFTITSMGNIGGLFATPIINYPEVGIMGVYKIQEKPIVQNGQIVIGKTMHLSLSLDHRVVDGALGAAFCNSVIERLANPTKLLLEMA